MALLAERIATIVSLAQAEAAPAEVDAPVLAADVPIGRVAGARLATYSFAADGPAPLLGAVGGHAKAESSRWVRS
jgi:hypothetical protein